MKESVTKLSFQEEKDDVRPPPRFATQRPPLPPFTWKQLFRTFDWQRVHGTLVIR
jgi:hypothetical protein